MAAPESGLIWCDPGGSLHRVGNSKSDLRLFAVRMASVTDERNMRDYVYLHPHADHTNAGWLAFIGQSVRLVTCSLFL